MKIFFIIPEDNNNFKNENDNLIYLYSIKEEKNREILNNPKILEMNLKSLAI